MTAAVADPADSHLRGAAPAVRRFILGTRDAHDLYARHGFTSLRAPERMMEILRPDTHKQQSTT
jgi:hypothetical protein